MKLLAFILALTGSIFTVNAQKSIQYNLMQLLKDNKLETTVQQQTQPLSDTKQGISTKGIVWLKGVDFKDGTIDIDLRGKDVFLQSFLGIAFHGVDTNKYDVVYFRPFNFRHADTLRRKWSVQYVSVPDYGWDKLRKEHPLTYENAVDPIPKADEWFHATIIIKDDWVSVYVNHSPKPSLKVRMLNNRKDGKIGLWDDELSGDFANLTITTNP